MTKKNVIRINNVHQSTNFYLTWFDYIWYCTCITTFKHLNQSENFELFLFELFFARSLSLSDGFIWFILA